MEDLYHSALEQPAAQRLSFLAQACNGDFELQQSIEVLLAQTVSPLSYSNSDLRGFLDRPAWENVPDLLDETAQFEDRSQLGPYRLLGEISKGGMATVYRAHDSRLGRDVAIKIASARFSARVEREARAIAALNHPHICTLYDVGPDYLVMELCEGETLAARMGREMLPLTDAIRYGAQIADALAEAHRLGIVHRDIKPQNIMLTAGDRVKVLDFGIAETTGLSVSKAVTAGSATVAGAIIGTVRYMSPEQAQGEEPDARGDIFSLGILLYELLAGEHPFARPDARQTLAAILTKEPRSIPSSSPVPVDLREILWKCLEKDKTRRCQSAGELSSQLRAVAARLGNTREPESGTPIPLPPPLAAICTDAAFVGRDPELRSLTAAWEHAKSAQRSLVLVAGEPGMGKTRLCAEFACSCAAEGATVLTGRSDEQALLPYQPFVEALQCYASMCPQPDLLSQLSEIGGGAELRLLLPELVRKVPALPALAPMDAEGQRFRLFETVSAFLAAISRSRPTLLVFDDLHWADQPSLLMLRHLARASGPARLCIVANYRDTEMAPEKALAAMFADLRRELFTARISLTGLARLHVNELVESIVRGVPGCLVEAVAEKAGGNPFFVGEMVRHLIETEALDVLGDTITSRRPELGVPEGIKDIIRQRLGRLSEDCNQVLRLAAVIGQEFDLILLEKLSGVPEDRLLDVIDEGFRAQLIREAAGGHDRCRFAHSLIQETLYDDLSGPRRARLHRRIGETMERLGGHDPPLADLAWHFARTAGLGEVEKAVDYASRAGDRAALSLAHEEAARFYEMALRSLDFARPGPETSTRRCAIHARRGRAFGAVAQWRLAKQEFESALRYLDANAIELRCEMLLGIADASIWLGGEITSVSNIASDALRLAEQLAQRSDLVVEAMRIIGQCKLASGDLKGSAVQHSRAIELAPGRPTMSYAFETLCLYLLGRSQEAVHLGRRAADIARAAHDTLFTMNTLPHLAISLSAAGEYVQAREVFAEARLFGREYGVVGPLARVISFEAGMHLSVFDFEGAEALQREALEMAAGAEFPMARISSRIDLLLTLARTGRPGAAEGLLKETTADAVAHPFHQGLWRARISQARAELSFARQDRSRAIEEAATAAAQSRALGRPKYEALAFITSARALGELQRTHEAAAEARRAIASARRTADPALLLSTLDVLLGLDGDDTLLAEARALITSITAALARVDEAMRSHFVTSETVRRIQTY
jgi:serine/threonine protein kinase/tetratricopeptide (TPR) repeat protein